MVEFSVSVVANGMVRGHDDNNSSPGPGALSGPVPLVSTVARALRRPDFCRRLQQLLHEGVRVDRAQRAQRPVDLGVDLLLGGFMTTLALGSGDRCAALLQVACGAFHQRVHG